MHTLGQRYKKEVKKKHVFTFFHFDKCEKVRFGICNYQKRTFSKSLRVCGRFRKEHIAVGHVLKHDGAIVFWMNTFFHFELKY